MSILEQFYNDVETIYYFPNSQGEYIQRKSGRILPPSERSWNYPLYNRVPVYLVGADTSTIYVYINMAIGHHDLSPRLSIKSFSQQDAKKEQDEYLWTIVAFSMIGLLALYNLTIYFYTRDKSYLLYAVAFLLFSIFITFRRATFIMWMPYPGVHIYQLIGTTGILTGIFYMQFSLSYLGGQDLLPKLRANIKKIVWVNTIVCTIMCIIYIVSTKTLPPIISHINNVSLMVGIMSVFVLAVKLSAKKVQTARYYLYASTVFLPFLAIFLAQGPDLVHTGFFNLIPSTPFTRASLNIGAVCQALAFSLALAARINLMRNEIANQKEEQERLEREKLLEIQKLTEQKNKELEQTVMKRTQSLQEANEELKLSEESLHQINKTKDHFFAIISHELREPVASFQGLSETLLYQIEKNNMKLVKDMVGHVDKSTNQLSALLDNLLKWAQSQLGGMTYKPQALSLRAVAQDIQQIYSTIAQSKGVKTSIDIEPSDLQVWADAPSTATVLRNLWGNAMKFTENGSISLSARAENDLVHIVVKDTGLGIDEEKLATIFDIDQAKSTKGTQGERGNGLGLVLCQEFAKQNNGKITIESEEGKGTKLHLWLPISRKG